MISILGPTATGKTTVAARVASTLNGAVVSADSRQVYRGMDLGTGKDLQDYLVDGKAVPYYLIDIVEPGTEYNLYEYRKAFEQVYNDLIQKSITPVFCGGTGMYLDSVLYGYELPEAPIDESFRKSMENIEHAELIEMLKEKLPIHNITDVESRERTLRALEIAQASTGLEKASFKKIPSLVFGIDLPRELVRERITKRLDERLNAGMIEEVGQLLEQGVPSERLIMYGLEYRYITQYLLKELDYDSMFRLLNIAIHQFSKRQMTWFRRMQKRGIDIQWIDGMLHQDEKSEIIIDRYKKWLPS